MKTLIPVQYIRFEKSRTRGKGGLFSGVKVWTMLDERNEADNILGLKVIRKTGIYEGNKERELAQLERLLAKYDHKEAVITADPAMADYLGISDMLFQARKRELLQNLSFILDTLSKGSGSNENAAIVLDNRMWDSREIFLILTAVKKYCRNITILTNQNNFNPEYLTELAYDEWGLVLTIYPLDYIPVNRQDVVFFLLRRWNSLWRQRLYFQKAYLVAGDESRIVRHMSGHENGDARSRVKQTEGRQEGGQTNANGMLDTSLCNEDGEGHSSAGDYAGVVFSGLVYQSKGMIPYELGVNMAYQKPVIYEKFHVSVIDIYSLE